MNNDYKNNILNWLTGNYEVEEPGADTPTFTTPSTSVGNFKTQIASELEDFSITNIIECNSASSDTNLMVVYGTYEDGTITRGFIAIVDNSANLVQLMTTYSNGTKIKPYIVLEMGEDGNFFGIDRNSADTTRNFVLLNNIIIKLPTQTDYEVKIRQSYTVPSGNVKSQNIVGIAKKPGNAVYLIYGDKQMTSNSQPWVTQLTINVGSENEWKAYTYSNTAIDVYVKTIYVSDWENINITIGAFDYVKSNYNVWYSEYAITDSEATTLTRNLKTRLLLASGSTSVGVLMYGIEIYDTNYAYVQYAVRSNGLNPTTQFISRIERSSGEKYDIIEKLSDHTAIMPYPMQLKKVNNVIFAMWCEVPYDDTYNQKIKVGQIVDTDIYTNDMIIISDSQGYTGDNYDGFFFVNNVYEVYTIIALGTRDTGEENEYITVSTQEVYRNVEYNGVAYNGIDSMIPYDAVLYDSSDNVIFARNLYNKTLNGNVLTATIEIPNISINDISINTKKLRSNTNNILVTDAVPFTKNIYEAVYLNFVTKLKMSNANDEDNIIDNPTGASRLLDSVSNTLDYNNCIANKYRINYADATTLVKDINPTYDSENNTYKYEWLVYVGKIIDNIQIISNDGAVAYLTIDGSSLELNKLYKISQDVTIE